MITLEELINLRDEARRNKKPYYYIFSGLKKFKKYKRMHEKQVKTGCRGGGIPKAKYSKLLGIYKRGR